MALGTNGSLQQKKTNKGKIEKMFQTTTFCIGGQRGVGGEKWWTVFFRSSISFSFWNNWKIQWNERVLLIQLTQICCLVTKEFFFCWFFFSVFFLISFCFGLFEEEEEEEETKMVPFTCFVAVASLHFKIWGVFHRRRKTTRAVRDAARSRCDVTTS